MKYKVGDKVKVQGETFEFSNIMLGGNEGVITQVRDYGYCVKFPKGNVLLVKESEIAD